MTSFQNLLPLSCESICGGPRVHPPQMSSCHILGPLPECHGGPNAIVLPSLLLLIKEKE